ncbi:hypothetical protein EON65_21190 [archaeon]|nr:MAG: hypothetical protein EON65_21190 [archaeon]
MVCILWCIACSPVTGATPSPTWMSPLLSLLPSSNSPPRLAVQAESAAKKREVLSWQSEFLSPVMAVSLFCFHVY